MQNFPGGFKESIIECLFDLKSRDPWFEPHWRHYVFVLGHFILNMLDIVLVGLKEISECYTLKNCSFIKYSQRHQASGTVCFSVANNRQYEQSDFSRLCHIKLLVQ